MSGSSPVGPEPLDDTGGGHREGGRDVEMEVPSKERKRSR